MRKGNQQLGARLRVVLEPDVAIGPGKTELLQGIQETGSIAAAGRRMGMSYKRAWGLVEEMNGDFHKPVVETTKGGQAKGGAQLTPTGEKVLGLYRAMEMKTREAIKKDMTALRKLRSP